MLEKSKVKGPRPRRREALRSGPGVTARVPPLRAVGWSSVRRDRRGRDLDHADGLDLRDLDAAADRAHARGQHHVRAALRDLQPDLGEGGLGLVGVGVVAHARDLLRLELGLLGVGGGGEGGDDGEGAKDAVHDSLQSARVWARPK